MKSSIRGFIVAFVIGSVFCSAIAASELEITALGNEGFLLECADSVVLIDGLYRGIDGYFAPSSAEQRRREGALPPYDKVDLVLASHHHGDHFDAEMVGKYLLANPKAELVTTNEAAQLIHRQVKKFDSIAGRIHGVEPPEGKWLRTSAGGLDIEIAHLHHGDRNPPVPNLGIVIEICGLRVLHMGDTEASANELEIFQINGRRLAVALVPYWHLLKKEEAVGYQTALGAETIIAMHLPDPNAPSAYFSPANDRPGLIALLTKSSPGAIVLDEPGAQHRVRSQLSSD